MYFLFAGQTRQLFWTNRRFKVLKSLANQARLLLPILIQKDIYIEVL
jgi:hypothetical protein